MRNQIFRTPATLVDDPYGTVVALKDVDGVSPLTLFLENMDQFASLRTKFGSKNANVRVVAVTAGAAGNSVTVEITAAPDQEFSVGVVGNDITVNLQCDGDGRPNQMVSDIIDLINADVAAAALVRVVLALGSDGSAVMELVAGDSTHALVQTALTGGSAAVTAGAATVEYSPTGAPDMVGPWVAHAAAGTALSGVAANTVKSYTLVDLPVRGLRISVVPGVGDTYLVATGQAEKKGV